MTEYSKADVVFVCSNCDYDFKKGKVKLKNYIKNIDQISKKIKRLFDNYSVDATPGTTDKILEPIIKKNLEKRGIKNFYLSFI